MACGLVLVYGGEIGKGVTLWGRHSLDIVLSIFEMLLIGGCHYLVLLVLLSWCAAYVRSSHFLGTPDDSYYGVQCLVCSGVLL